MGTKTSWAELLVVVGSSCQCSVATPVALGEKGKFQAHRVKEASWTRWLVVVGTPLLMPWLPWYLLTGEGSPRHRKKREHFFLALIVSRAPN